MPDSIYKLTLIFLGSLALVGLAGEIALAALNLPIPPEINSAVSGATMGLLGLLSPSPFFRKS
ncbi:MAG TPA: hypothetical protein VK211_08780 [Kamptonema sp.]|nr:hypothetical protein [Kamptonema sp.]